MQVLGVIGNPVSHSKSPALHNAALQAAGVDSIYVPLLVDDLTAFLQSCPEPDFAGFSVTIPHKVHLCILILQYLKLFVAIRQISAAWDTLICQSTASTATGRQVSALCVGAARFSLMRLEIYRYCS